MSQYQSFPGTAGDSRTVEKLKALRLPDLKGKRFLDVGCNEGYFCGFARFMGANVSVGVDYSAGFIHRAQTRFPDCTFLARDWSQLPDGAFDVILLASALHYAEDQAALIRRLVDKLSDDGLLVLELGIVSSPRAEWVKVKRGADERYFPTMPQLQSTLADYAWKWMGKSVNQAGDPVQRHVLHIARRRPVAYLLMQPPGYGKSSISTRLFGHAEVTVVQGDHVIQQIAQRKLTVSEHLQQLVAKDFSPFHIDQTIARVFDKKAGPALVEAWVTQAGSGDFALDGYVPVKHHAHVEQALRKLGYFPVTLRWERAALPLLPAASMDAQVRAFERQLDERPATTDNEDVPPIQTSTGYIDRIEVKDGHLALRGWAVEGGTRLPDELVVGVGAERTFVPTGTALSRKDVQQHLGLPHAEVGFQIELDAPDMADLRALGQRGFSVTLSDGHPLRIARNLLAQMQGHST